MTRRDPQVELTLQPLAKPIADAMRTIAEVMSRLVYESAKAMYSLADSTIRESLVEAAFRGHASRSGERVCDGDHSLLTERCAYCRAVT